MGLTKFNHNVSQIKFINGTAGRDEMAVILLRDGSDGSDGSDAMQIMMQ